MSLLARNSPGLQDLEKAFEKAMADGVQGGQNLKRELLPAAALVFEMVQTKGWKEVIEPFLKKNGDPSGLLGRTKDEYEKLEPRINAFYRFRRLIDSLVEIHLESKKSS